MRVRALKRAIAYLRRSQEPEGSWFGRWGVNYIYGTSAALCGLAAAGISRSDPMGGRAILWVLLVQEPDGGRGEGVETYRNRSLMGRGMGTASQTAWALLGLIVYLSSDHPAIERGIRWLIDRQVNAGTPGVGAGTWEESESTGTGFPRHFYLRYHLY